MRSSGRLRRTVAITACGALASALAWLPGGSALALGPSNTLSLRGDVSFSSGTPTCTEVGTEPTSSTPFSHGSVSDSLSMDTTVTNTDATTPDPGDHTHVTGHVSATGRVKKHNGSMSSFLLTGSGRVSVVRAEGNASQCDVTAQMSAQTTSLFSEVKPGWVYITREQAKNMLTLMLIGGEDGSGPYEDIFSGPKSKNTERAFLRPGNYEAISAFIVSTSPLLILKAGAPSARLSGVFHAAGSALGGTRGAAGKFVRFPGSISCSHRSAKLTWTGKAGQVNSGAFFVNGQRKASVSSPKSGHTVVLRHLSKTADNKITAKLSLKGGGTASATRAYVPCKG